MTQLVFSILKSWEKTKDDSSHLRFLMSLMRQVLRWTFSFKESEKEWKRLLWKSRQRGLPNQSKNCRILFMVRQPIFPNVVFSALWSIDGRHGFLRIKDVAYCGLPIYTRRYVGAQVHTGTCRLKVEESPNQQWKQQLPGFTTLEYVSSLDF